MRLEIDVRQAAGGRDLLPDGHHWCHEVQSQTQRGRLPATGRRLGMRRPLCELLRRVRRRCLRIAPNHEYDDEHDHDDDHAPDSHGRMLRG